jgi:hypothetical protein
VAGPTEPLEGRVNDPIAASFVTTEHLALQSARAQTVAESTSRASMFLSAVSAGLVALGLMATATQVGPAFYAFALVVLPALAITGLATFGRTLQSGIEDFRYARRIVDLRAYYFDKAPELLHYLASVPVPKRLEILGLWNWPLQSLRTVSGMVAIVTSVVAGSAVGLAAAIVFSRPFVVGFTAGFLTAAALLAVLLSRETVAWKRVRSEKLSDLDEEM